MRFKVHVHPGARSEEVGGSYSGALVVRVRARAIDGAANEAVTRALAKAFGVSITSVDCLRGNRSRRKYFNVTGEESSLQSRFEQLLNG